MPSATRYRIAPAMSRRHHSAGRPPLPARHAGAGRAVVLRHENTVLRRHAGRLRYEPADRAWLASLTRLIPRRRWAEVFPVTPATLLAWHRRLAARKYDTSKRRKPGRPPAVPGAARLVVRLAKENPLWDTAGSTANWPSSA